MRYTFDLSGSGMQRFEFFPEATAALKMPAERPKALSVLVWGAVVHEPENDAELCNYLTAEVRAALPSPVYLSGWGVLDFRDIRRGDVTVSPYGPNLLGKDFEFLKDRDGNTITLSHTWPGPVEDDVPEYLFSMVLEQPFGFMALKIATPEPVRLVVDPRDFVTEEQLTGNPDRYAYDFARVRQLQVAESVVPGGERHRLAAVLTQQTIEVVLEQKNA